MIDRRHRRSIIGPGGINMSTDPLSRLRALNPVPETLPPPPLRPLLERIRPGDASLPLDADEQHSNGPATVITIDAEPLEPTLPDAPMSARSAPSTRRPRWNLIPAAIGLAATALVLAVIITAAVRHNRPTHVQRPAGPTSAQQRIAITSPNGNANVFVLTPLTSGPIVRDSGTASYCCITPRFVQRDGQSIEIDNPTKSFVGRRGTFVWRAQIDWVKLNNGWSVGTGTWKIVLGTGAYKHLEGHGRLAVIMGNQSQVGPDAEGLVHLAR
jgi:hypothetical protein